MTEAYLTESEALQLIADAHAALDHVNGSDADEDAVERATDRVDELCELQPRTLPWAHAHLRLLLANDGENMDEPLRRGLDGLEAFLSECMQSTTARLAIGRQ